MLPELVLETLHDKVDGVCELHVNFAGRGLFDKNGPGATTLSGTHYGLGFTVKGSVTEGDIGVVQTGVDRATGQPIRDVVNPNGTWTVQQWFTGTSSYTYHDGSQNTVSTPTRSDGPYNDWRLVSGNSFTYFDFPGPIPVFDNRILTSYDADMDFEMKVIRGNQQCDIRFSVKMQLRNGHFQAFWRAR
jgi:hypothetical protein